MGCVVTWVAWIALVKLLRGLRRLRGLKYLLRGRGLRGSNIFLRGSKFFAWVNFFTWVNIFLRELKISVRV